MDPSFFGLDDNPFGRFDDDVQGGYLAAAHAQLTTELRAGLKAPHGITLLIGQEGAGKTTLVKSFAARIADSCTVAYLPSTGPGLRHLLIEIIEQLGGSASEGGSERALLESLRSLAKARAEHERATVVIIDDAHDLPAKTIERLGRLFGEDPADPSMLHIILVGRAELLDRMNAATDRSILKHLVQVCRMDPIGPEESFRYIADRIAKVGGTVDRIFSEDALRLIVKRANGLPAHIDAICTAALTQAAQRGEESIGTDTVDVACMDLEGLELEGRSDENGTEEPQGYAFGDEQEMAEEPSVDEDLQAEDLLEHEEPAPAYAGHEDIDVGDEIELGPSSNDQQQSVPTGRGRPVGLVGAMVSLYEGRRQLVLWALGLVVAIGVFAAFMTGTREETATRVAAVEPHGPAAAQTSNKAAQVETPAKPQTIPNLVVTRPGAGASQGEAAAGGTAGSVGESAAAAPSVEKAAPAAAAKAENVEQARAAGEAAAHRPVVEAPPYHAGGVAAGAAQASSAEAASQASEATQRARAAAERASAAAKADAAAKAAAATAAPKKAGASVASAHAVPAETHGSEVAAAAPRAGATAPSEKPVMAPPQKTAAVSGRASATASAAGKGSPAKASAVQTAKAESTGGFTVQLGAFRSRSNAEALLTKLEKTKLDGRILTTTASGGTFYHVVSGAFASRHDAIRRAAKLKRSGFSTYVRSNVAD